MFGWVLFLSLPHHTTIPDGPDICQPSFSKGKNMDKSDITSILDILLKNAVLLVICSAFFVKTKFFPDPPSRCHLLRCLRSLLPATYCLYVSVVAPWRLASNTLLVSRIYQNPSLLQQRGEFDSGFWSSNKALIFQMNSSDITRTEHRGPVCFDKN